MAEDSNMFSTGSMQTFIAASFVVALLALGMSVYNYSQTRSSVSALLDLQAAGMHANTDDGGAAEALAEAEAALTDLQKRVKSLEEKAAASAADSEE